MACMQCTTLAYPCQPASSCCSARKLWPSTLTCPSAHQIAMPHIAARDGSAPLPATETAGAAWPNVASCAERPSWLPAEAPIPCPHPNRFFFPRADAFLAKSTHEPVTEVDKEVQSAVAEYAASNEDWLNSFARAYVRMVDLGADMHTRSAPWARAQEHAHCCST